MGFFSKLFGRRKQQKQSQATSLLPRPEILMQSKFVKTMVATPEIIWKQYLEQRAEIAKELQHLNHCYMLGLPDLTKEKYTASITCSTIVHSHNPFQAFVSNIAPSRPTIAEFCLSMENMLNLLMEEMKLSEDDMGNIYVEFLSMTTAVTDELISEIASSFANVLPPQMSFLKNKVNYELACLGHIMQHGMSSNRQDICQKVNSIRKKRGYID